MSEQQMSTPDETIRRYYLETMGIQCWQQLQAEADPPQALSVAASSDPDHAVVTRVDGSKLEAQHDVDDAITRCERCDLHVGRKQAIAGRGMKTAQLMLILLAPTGADDENAVLCSGDEGELLSKMLSAIDIDIRDVYITSLLKCRVPVNHTITPAEIQHCHHHLAEQLSQVDPRMLMVLGETAVRCLLQKNVALDDLRERNGSEDLRLQSRPLFVSYAPSELISEPLNKRKAWQDLQKLQTSLSGI